MAVEVEDSGGDNAGYGWSVMFGRVALSACLNPSRAGGFGLFGVSDDGGGGGGFGWRRSRLRVVCQYGRESLAVGGDGCSAAVVWGRGDCTEPRFFFLCLSLPELVAPFFSPGQPSLFEGSFPGG
jgi:hypothetical protein